MAAMPEVWSGDALGGCSSMYCEFYQFRERPFNVTPDPKFLYLNARYREAIASLHYGITQRKGFITLIGEAGTGKTTLLKRLLEELDRSTRTVFLFNTNVSFEEILEYMFAEFDLPIHSGKKLYMLQRLNMFLLEELRNGRNVALLIDEAQDLEYGVLEDLRLLSNLETAKEKIIQIVLSGQPELGQKLSNPVLRQLRQRISVNCRLLPLSREEVSEYIRFRLEAAGAPDTRVFSRDAEEYIYRFSRGIPRLVNVVCDNALVIGYAMGKKRITAEIIEEAAADLLPVDSASTASDEAKGAGEQEQPRLERVRFNQSRSWWQRVALTGAVLATGLAAWTAARSIWQAYVAAPASVEEPARTAEIGVIEPPDVPVRAEAIDVVRGEVAEAPQRARESESEALAPVAGAQAEKAGSMTEVSAPAPTVSAVETEPVPRLAMLADVPVESVALGGSPEDERILAEDRPSGAEQNLASSGSVGDRSERRIHARGDMPEQDKPEPGFALPSSPGLSSSREVGARLGDVVSLGGRRQQRPPEGPSAPQVDVAEYGNLVVRPGDSLSAIARAKYGQSSYTVLDLIKLANPEVEDVDLIVPGQTLRLPDVKEGPPVVREGPGRYALLVLSTPNGKRAQALVRALRQRGFDAHASPTELGAQKKVFRVTVQAGSAREDALRTGSALQRVLREDAEIVRFGQ